MAEDAATRGQLTVSKLSMDFVALAQQEIIPKNSLVFGLKPEFYHDFSYPSAEADGN